MPTVTEWILAIILATVNFGFIIAILYSVRRFYKHQYSQALQKRSPILVYFMNLFYILYLLYHITYNLAYIYGVKELNTDTILTGGGICFGDMMSLISVIFYKLSLCPMTIMWIARSWIIYFNCQYGLQIQV